MIINGQLFKRFKIQELLNEVLKVKKIRCTKINNNRKEIPSGLYQFTKFIGNSVTSFKVSENIGVF